MAFIKRTHKKIFVLYLYNMGHLFLVFLKMF